MSAAVDKTSAAKDQLDEVIIFWLFVKPVEHFVPRFDHKRIWYVTDGFLLARPNYR